MEIYNEKVNDLLTKENKNLKVSEDPQGNVIVKGLTETITNSSQMVSVVNLSYHFVIILAIHINPIKVGAETYTHSV